MAFIQGQYHLTFYAKYWLLNNTLMPLEVQIKTSQYKFEIMNLPYEAQDFDFETHKSFGKLAGGKGDPEGKDQGRDDPSAGKHGLKRENSEETILTQTQGDEGLLKVPANNSQPMSQLSASAYSIKKGTEDQINYRNMIKGQQAQANERSQFGRIKPWESYKFQ